MKVFKYTLLFFASAFAFSCNERFLDVKPRSTLVVPQTLTDFDQLLNNQNLIYVSSELLEIQADDFYLDYDYWESLSWAPAVKNTHIWADDSYGGEQNVDNWNKPYSLIFYANVVLEGLEKISVVPSNSTEHSHIKGKALFYRGLALYNLLQLFAPAYDPTSATSDPGVPIRTSSNVNLILPRSSVKQCYDQVLSDLIQAEEYLKPLEEPTKPSKAAAAALLARVFLNIQDYENAIVYADKCLAMHPQLSDFNDFTSLPGYHAEILYLALIYPQVIIRASNRNIHVDTLLYGVYEEGDLRKELFFQVNSNATLTRVAGSDFVPDYFAGLATDEVYLIRAECLIRTNRTTEGMRDINWLLKHRYKAGSHRDTIITDQREALEFVLLERRKELVFRGIRWSDLRRLNVLNPVIELKRFAGTVNEYTLPPDGKRWVLPIPENELAYNNNL